MTNNLKRKYPYLGGHTEDPNAGASTLANTRQVEKRVVAWYMQ